MMLGLLNAPERHHPISQILNMKTGIFFQVKSFRYYILNNLGVALVPEGQHLFSNLTVQENMEVGGYSQPKANILHNLERVLSLFPQLGVCLKQESNSLSGGEQQMLAIGRALKA